MTIKGELHRLRLLPLDAELLLARSDAQVGDHIINGCAQEHDAFSRSNEMS